MSILRERSIEEARLFNPGFLSLLVWSATRSYEAETGDSFPFELTFVALPIALHKRSRDLLPRSTRTSLTAWLEENPELRVGFADRARGLAPFVREAVLFGTIQGLVSIGEDGRLIAADRPRTLTQYLRSSSDEVRDCEKRSGFLGKWLGTAGTPTTVMALLGVAP